jgi:hypothetical protein
LNRLLNVAILVISTTPLCAQRQQQNVAKLKADARNLVGVIGSDKTKIQTYCQIDDLSEQLDQAIEKKDNKKAKTLAGKITELNKKMGPEFRPGRYREACQPKFGGRPGNRFNRREPRRSLWGGVRTTFGISIVIPAHDPKPFGPQIDPAYSQIH